MPGLINIEEKLKQYEKIKFLGEGQVCVEIMLMLFMIYLLLKLFLDHICIYTHGGELTYVYLIFFKFQQGTNLFKLWTFLIWDI